MNALREKKWIVIVMVFILACLSVYGIAHRKGVMHFVRERRDLMSECVPVLAYHGFVPEKVKNELFRVTGWPRLVAIGTNEMVDWRRYRFL